RVEGRHSLLVRFVAILGILALIGMIAAGFAVLAGSAAAWLLLAQIFEVQFLFDPAAAATTAVLALTVSTVAGLIATWRALSQPPA
ncbi:MAG: hypothetical protein NWR47_00945, partial [Aestuariivirgaceae bacterium]|nr:hypothetical protein [Aestuariivirgaceae bacterium]